VGDKSLPDDGDTANIEFGALIGNRLSTAVVQDLMDLDIDMGGGESAVCHSPNRIDLVAIASDRNATSRLLQRPMGDDHLDSVTRITNSGSYDNDEVSSELR
jgi:hypothetical protein